MSEHPFPSNFMRGFHEQTPVSSHTRFPQWALYITQFPQHQKSSALCHISSGHTQKLEVNEFREINNLVLQGFNNSMFCLIGTTVGFSRRPVGTHMNLCRIASSLGKMVWVQGPRSPSDVLESVLTLPLKSWMTLNTLFKFSELLFTHL